MDNFNEKVVENLKNEIECLNHSLVKARQDGNFSMYKNLINSYRETVMLINELSGNNLKVKSSIIQTPEKIIVQIENGRLTTKNNEIIMDKNGINIKGDIKYYAKEYNENKIFCKECKKQLDKKHFYKIGNSEYPICKDCLKKMIRDKNGELDVDKFENILKDMNVEFIGVIFYSVIGNERYKDYNIIGDYLRKYIPYKLTSKTE